MKKMRSLAAVLLAAVFVCTACGSGGGDAKGDGDKKEEKKSSNTLVVYSPQGDDERGKWIIDRAKKDTGIDVQFLAAGGGELADRLEAEKNNPQADVVMGLVQNSMYTLKSDDILEAYVPSWAEGLPDAYKDPDGYFHSFWQTPIVMAYNPDYMSEADAPSTWTDLADPKFKDKFAFGTTSSQTVRTYLVGILWNYYDSAKGDISDEGWDVLKKIYANAGTWPSSDDALWKEFKDGEMAIMPNWFGGIASNTKANDIPVEYVKPADGTPMVAEAIGIVKGTKQEENAKKFVDWWGSADVMSDYAAEFGQAPAHPDAIAKCPDDIKEQATMFTAQNIDWEVVSEHLNDWMEKIELEIIP